MIENPSAALFQ